MQQAFKLSRASGTMNVLVMHRLSYLGAAGAAGSLHVRLAEGLLADTETRVIYGQPPSEIDYARELLGLSDTEAKLLPHLPRGQALWKVGTRSFLVEHHLSAMEMGLVDTDGRMRTTAERLTARGSAVRGTGVANHPPYDYNSSHVGDVALGRDQGSSVGDCGSGGTRA